MWTSFARSAWDAPIGMRATRAAEKRPKIFELSDIPLWTDTYADIRAEEAAAEAAEAEASTNSPSASDLSVSASANTPRSRSQSRSKSASRGKSPHERLAKYTHADDDSKPDSGAAAAASDERKTNADPTASKAGDAVKPDTAAMQDVETSSAEVGPATAAAAASSSAAASTAAVPSAAPAAAAVATAADDEDLPVDPRTVDVASALDIDSITTDTEDRAELYDKFFKPNADFNAKVRLYQGDITKLRVDAIVNAANSGLWAGGGICGAIFDAAGEDRLKRACRAIRQVSGECPPGETRLTRGFLLPAPFILHTVGPMDGDELDLIRSYESTLDMCAHPILHDQKDGETISIRSVALCCISTGIYGFENDAACEVALRTTRLWLEKHPAEAANIDAIVFCVFLGKDLKLYRDMMPIFFPVDDDDDEDDEVEAAETSQSKKQKQQQPSPRGKPAAAGASNKSGPASSSSSAAAASAAPAGSTKLPALGSPEFKKRKSESEDEDDMRSESKQQPSAASAAARADAREVHDLCEDSEDEPVSAAAKHAGKKPRVQQ